MEDSVERPFTRPSACLLSARAPSRLPQGPSSPTQDPRGSSPSAQARSEGPGQRDRAEPEDRPGAGGPGEGEPSDLALGGRLQIGGGTGASRGMEAAVEVTRPTNCRRPGASWGSRGSSRDSTLMLLFGHKPLVAGRGADHDGGFTLPQGCGGGWPSIAGEDSICPAASVRARRPPDSAGGPET